VPVCRGILRCACTPTRAVLEGENGAAALISRYCVAAAISRPLTSDDTPQTPFWRWAADHFRTTVTADARLPSRAV